MSLSFHGRENQEVIERLGLVYTETHAHTYTQTNKQKTIFGESKKILHRLRRSHTHAINLLGSSFVCS